MTVLEKHIVQLSSHVVVVSPESDVATTSYFEVVDFCVTVTGTIGLEAASIGVPGVTAGTGRYDHHGFTVDSDSRDQYLERLRSIQDIPRLPAAQREL